MYQIALLCLLLFPQHQIPETTTLTLSADQPAIIMPREDARAMYERLEAKDTLTPVEEKWYAALVVGLGVFRTDTFLDCSGLSYSERMRIEMGSSYELSKCVKRTVKKGVN